MFSVELDTGRWKVLDEVALATPPPADDVRPGLCPHCGASRWSAGDRVVIESNGVRFRPVVIPDFRDGVGLRRVRCWTRRYRCTGCKRSCTVLPKGVLPGCVYSIAAIALCWWTRFAPSGALDSEVPVCAPAGADRPIAASPPARWRSPYRWFARIDKLWPAVVSGGGSWRTWLKGLMLSFAIGARSFGPEAIVRWALAMYAAPLSRL